ncbi:hypothetical protein [Kitasatospora sp. SUK 42]|uniref:hypothetical protein n=1 Tax=Kitasatospora sp. SUK 42 TaxID=1588882 RepID=UPI0018CB9499|nr:hypothetical protein [Kitasatospora sp. SUK 42]MBV2153619.1 hypothetical protein [Kitasatospora sp. SUK 42]
METPGRALSRRGALLLAVGGLTQLSLPPAAPAVPTQRAADPHAEVAGLLAERARSLPSWSGLTGAEAAYRNLVLSPAGGPDRLTAAADLVVRIAGYDEYPEVYPRRITLVRDAGGWRVEREEGASGPPALWDLGPARTAPGAHCLVLGLAEGSDPSGLVAVGDHAVPAVSAVWGDAWPGRLLLELPATEAQFARLLEADPAGWTGMAAVTVAAPGAPHHTPADRVVVNPEAFGRLSGFGRQVVITHEATHVATRADTRAWTPLWLSEGVADWTAYRDSGREPRQIAPELARDVTAGRLPGALPADQDFAAGATGIAQAYEQSWLACDLIARHWGPERLVAFYRAVGAEDGRGEERERRTDRLLRADLGVGLDGFTELWRAEVAALKSWRP